MQIITKTTSKGQITIPAKWRNQFKTDNFLVEVKDKHLEIRPINLKEITKQKEYTVFDAIRDNKGKGIKAKDLARLLRKTI